MTSQPSIRIWWDGSVSAYRLTSPYSKELVEMLKLKIPVSDRSFDPQTKIWTFTEQWLTPLKALLTALAFQTTVITRAQAEAAAGAPGRSSTSSPTNPQHGVNTLDAVLVTFMRLIPYDAAQSAYRKAALALHPDRAASGGSMEKMQQLNVAWTRLEKELYNQ